jgi:hypothetical protein
MRVVNSGQQGGGEGEEEEEGTALAEHFTLYRFSRRQKPRKL